VFQKKERTQGGSGADGKYWLLADPDTFEESLCDEVCTVIVDCSEVDSARLLGITKAGGTI